MNLQKQVYFLLIAVTAFCSCSEPSRDHRDQPATSGVQTNVDTTARSKAYTADVELNGDEKNFLFVVTNNNLYGLQLSNLVSKQTGNTAIKTLAASIGKEMQRANASLFKIAAKKGLLLDTVLPPEQLDKVAILAALKNKAFEHQYVMTISNCYAVLTRELNKINKFKEQEMVVFATELLPTATKRYATLSKLAQP